MRATTDERDPRIDADPRNDADLLSDDEVRNHDVGLFGPDSVTWRLHAEPILWLAGFRALLLQSLLPRALAGVVQNSNFREDPWGRLFRTARFYGEVVYGPTARAEAAGARVRRIHARMSGVDPTTGEDFRIDEADLLRWVYVTATESFCHTAQRAGLGLSADEVDRYYDEQRVVASLVGLDPSTVPATASETEAYYKGMRPRLVANTEARATARFLAVPTFPWGLGFTLVRPMWIGVAVYGFSLLPPWARRLYGLPALPTTDLAATLTSRALRSAIRALPTKPLEGPLYRAAMERAELSRSESSRAESSNSESSRAEPVRPSPARRAPAREATSRASARAASATRKAGASATVRSTSTAGTPKARRRSAASAMTPMSAAPTTTPA